MSTIDPITGQTGTPSDPEHPREHVSFKHRAEYIGYRVIRALIRALPFKVASGFAATLWRWIAPHIYRHKRAVNHLKRAYPDKTDAQCEAIARRMWGHLGRTMAESFIIDRIAQKPELFDFHIPADVQSLIDAKKPMILTALHLGNWELPAVAMHMLGVEIAGVYQRILNPLVDDSIRQSRAPYYPLGILQKGQGAGKALMKLVRQGHSVGIVSDLRDNRGVAVPFFGLPARSTTFPAMLSSFDGVPIVAIQCVRLAPEKFRIDMQIISAPEGKDREDTILNQTSALQAQFERWIRDNPDQWMWAHRRWD